MGLADTDGYVVEGKSRPRVRRQPNSPLTKAQRKLFLEALAETCNVLLSAERAGVWPQRVYRLKASDATFRAGWDVALATGYAQLELTMLERALHGTETAFKAPDGKARTMRTYSDRLGLTLLKMHRDGAQAGQSEIDEAEQDEILKRLMTRLDRLKAREEGVDSAADEGGERG